MIPARLGNRSTLPGGSGFLGVLSPLLESPFERGRDWLDPFWTGPILGFWGRTGPQRHALRRAVDDRAEFPTEALTPPVFRLAVVVPF